MTQPIVECIPNFSEGRRPQVVDAIAQAISAVPGAALLDRNSDADHNRSVLTFAGSPQAVAEAAFATIAKAAELIDMTHQQGEHPRMGATDVVPFVPLTRATMEECVEMARALGQRVGSELGIPVYLYEQAATRPQRKNLANVRRGEYEGIRDSIASDPEGAPDFGPRSLGTAGATAIGARAPLIAFNVYLTSADVEIADKIARAVRHSSGGLRHVKALGMLVKGRAQVSMNLTDYTQTPVARVVEAIQCEATRYGVTIHSSELVGLIPQAALVDAAQWHLQLDRFESDQILETRLFATTQPPPDFIEAVAAGKPTPGGGSAAAHTAALAAALVAMVARLTAGKKKYAAVAERMEQIITAAEALRADQQAAVVQDAAAFDAVMTAYRQPKESEAEKITRATAIQRSLHRATEIPLQVAQQAAHLQALAVEVAENGNANASSDAVAGAQLARAALLIAALNVRINARDVTDREVAARWLNQLEELESRSSTLVERTESSVQAIWEPN
jgi:glutamate formiminotransferase/formiminotetrahydrofolate cyclodeaminase